jgi:hypothetical protein
MAFFEALSRHLPGDTEDDYKICEAGLCPKLDSKSVAPECESQALKHEMRLAPFSSLGVPIGSANLTETFPRRFKGQWIEAI